VNEVYLNGEFLPAEQAKVSVFDRGFLLGDGVYEVIPVYDGSCFLLEGHLARLQNSLDGIQLANPHNSQKWAEIINALIVKNGGGDQSLYLQVTRGVAPRDHVFPDNIEPTIFLMSNPLKPVPEEWKQYGIKAITVEDIRWQNCDIKAISLLPNSLLKQRAKEAGAQEALLIKDDYLTEGAASNAYAVINGTIYTAPKDEKVLPGITRDFVLDMAREHGLMVMEMPVSIERLREADEIWISSSTKEVLAVTELDGQPVGDGKPGPIWTQIDAFYQQYKQGK
jgi:D-alanine transaminase